MVYTQNTKTTLNERARTYYHSIFFGDDDDDAAAAYAFYLHTRYMSIQGYEKKNFYFTLSSLTQTYDFSNLLLFAPGGGDVVALAVISSSRFVSPSRSLVPCTCRASTATQKFTFSPAKYTIYTAQLLVFTFCGGSWMVSFVL